MASISDAEINAWKKLPSDKREEKVEDVILSHIYALLAQSRGEVGDTTLNANDIATLANSVATIGMNRNRRAECR